MQVAPGDRAGALKSYRESLAIRERLAQSDRGNAGWQRDLAVSYFNLAVVFRKQDDKANAVAALAQGRAIMLSLTKLSPENLGWKSDLAAFDDQIAELTR